MTWHKRLRRWWAWRHLTPAHQTILAYAAGPNSWEAAQLKREQDRALKFANAKIKNRG